MALLMATIDALYQVTILIVNGNNLTKYCIQRSITRKRWYLNHSIKKCCILTYMGILRKNQPLCTAVFLEILIWQNSSSMYCTSRWVILLISAAILQFLRANKELQESLFSGLGYSIAILMSFLFVDLWNNADIMILMITKL